VQRAWLLNLDADHELRKPLGYQPNREVLGRVAEMIPLIIGLVRDGDAVIGRDAVPPGAKGICWCPTPSALRQLARLGVKAPESPPFEVIRRVNHRRWCFALGGALAGSVWAREPADVRDAIGGTPRDWLLKRPHGMAGRGRRILQKGRLDPADVGWLAASFREDGVIVEPWVETVGELVVHGYVEPAGDVTIGAVCEQRVDRHGRWLETVLNPALPAADRAGMLGTAEEVARALHVEGYFGPFGVDGYRYRDGHEVRLQTRSEVNARYTMGWAVGMGSKRPDLDET
jgi:hypothetical protein